MQATPGKGKTEEGKKSKSNSWVCIVGCMALCVMATVGMIVIAGIGIAIPFFQTNLADAQKEKAMMDLDVIRSAVNLYNAQNRPLTGTKLSPLLGRYLQELPVDPWGNEYLFDSQVGVILSYGADAQAGGKGSDRDVVVYYKPPIQIIRAQYKGKWGLPRRKDRLTVTLSKPAKLVDKSLLLQSLCLVTSDGKEVSIAELQEKHDHQWMLLSDDVSKGRLSLISKKNAKSMPIEETMKVSLRTAVEKNGDAHSEFGLRELWLKDGPLEKDIYGFATTDLLKKPVTGNATRIEKSSR